MAVVVQKFGGTSVGSVPGRTAAAKWVAAAANRGQSPVVVVSAMGRKGDPYATDTLLGLVRDVSDSTARETDLLISCGEVISAVVMADCLRQAGLKPMVLTGGEAGLITDDHFGDAQIVEINPQPVIAAMTQGLVPVIAGFQGRTRAGQTTTLGRGGSDTSAVAIGAALGAEGVEIFTDVDGIKTADPRIVPDARTINRLDYDEVFQLANLGAQVIHPRAVEIARQFRVPLRVRSTFSGSPGTLVSPVHHPLDRWAHRIPDRSVTGITHLEHLVQFIVQMSDESDANWGYRLFDLLGDRGISVDLINLFPDKALFCVPSGKAALTAASLAEAGFTCQRHDDRAKVSIVGSAIQGLPGVVGHVMGALARGGIQVLQAADSHSTITLLLRRDDMERAVQALHVQFGLSAETDEERIGR